MEGNAGERNIILSCCFVHEIILLVSWNYTLFPIIIAQVHPVLQEILLLHG